MPVFGAFLRNSPLHRRFVPAAVVPVRSCKAAAHRRREVNFPKSTKRRPAVARQAFFFRSGGSGSCCGGVSVGSDPRKRLQTGAFRVECLICVAAIRRELENFASANLYFTEPLRRSGSSRCRRSPRSRARSGCHRLRVQFQILEHGCGLFRCAPFRRRFPGAFPLVCCITES